MSRDINREIYSGEHTLNQYVKYTDTFNTLAQAEKLTVNKALDDSCYLFYCIGDTLTRPRFARIYNNAGDIVLDPNTEGIPLENNNYMITYNQAGSVFSASPTSLYNILRNGATYPYGKRMGMGATLSEVADLSPCYDIATMYACLSIRCYMAEYTVSNDVYSFSNIEERSVASVLAENDSYWNNHACLAMWAKLYIGDASSRSVIGGVGVSPSFGGDSFSCSLVDSRTVDREYYSSETILQPAYNMASNYECLLQGSLSDIAVSDSTLSNYGDNIVIYWASANPSFFDIVCSYKGSGFSRFQAACFTKLKFESAFNAYNCTGLYYFDNDSDASNGDPSSKANAHRGKVDDDGRTSPDINDPSSKGLATDPEDMYTITGFNGNADIDPNNYVLDTPLTPPALTTINVFNRSFAMTANQISALADWLWNADEDKFIEIKEGLALMGENPMNGLIDCRLYPFAITDMIGHAGYELIVIGRTESTIGGVKLENSANCIIDLGECTFFEKNKNFLDYSPYTQARLYLPYCGWHNIDPAEFMGKRITGKLIVDVITGACNCLIYADGVILINATGAIGVEIPMTGTDSASFASQTLNAAMQCISKTAESVGMIAGGAGAISKGASLMNSAANTGASSNTIVATHLAGKSMANSGVDQIIQSPIPGVDAVYAGWKATAVPVQYEMTGAATPACANWLPQYAYFVIDRPVPLIPDNYGHTIGFACCESGLLSGYSGFTVCSNVDTSGFAQATEAERAELKALLEAGVYL